MTLSHSGFHIASFPGFQHCRWLAIALAALYLAACATRTPAPVEDRSLGPATRTVPSARAAAVAPRPVTPGDVEAQPQSYTVKRGDTLYLIALDHGLDYRELYRNLPFLCVLKKDVYEADAPLLDMHGVEFNASPE